jgi:hypothetical protein
MKLSHAALVNPLNPYIRIVRRKRGVKTGMITFRPEVAEPRNIPS